MLNRSPAASLYTGIARSTDAGMGCEPLFTPNSPAAFESASLMGATLLREAMNCSEVADDMPASSTLKL